MVAQNEHNYAVNQKILKILKTLKKFGNFLILSYRAKGNQRNGGRAPLIRKWHKSFFLSFSLIIYIGQNLLAN